MPDPDRDTASRPNRDEVQSVRRGMELLNLLSHSAESVSFADLSGQPGNPKTTVFRLLETLRERGYVDEEDRGFRLGPRPFELTSGALVQTDPRTRCGGDQLPNLGTQSGPAQLVA